MDSVPSDLDFSSSVDSGNGENQLMLIDSLQLHLQAFRENMNNDNWRPFVILLQPNQRNQFFYNYLRNCVWSEIEE